MPQLGLLLEGRPVPRGNYARLEPLSSRVRRVVGGDLTPQQQRALDVALNSPDVALIQGPPGTGKTRVIAALQQRLAEIAEKDGSVSGKVLLSSYQHEAVEHAVTTGQIFGLPALRVGGRRRDSRREDARDRWRRHQAHRIRQTLRSLGFEVADVLREIRRLAAAYGRLPGGRGETLQLLERVARVAGHLLSPETGGRLATHLSSLRTDLLLTADHEGVVELAIRAVRALRTAPEAFADDGPRIATRVLARLESLGVDDEDALALLRDATRAAVPDAILLERLRGLKERLLDRLLMSSDVPPMVDVRVEQLLRSAVDDLEALLRSSPAGVPLALAEYLEDLEGDPPAVFDTLQKYTAVVAATCQQARGAAMREVVGNSPTFETVIVDEAARANPLDLFIPMALASRRIVLVGDHRQLPHLIEHEIQRELEHALPDTQRALRESLFERLFKGVLREMERHDGVQRIVTLDVQFRMHPVLGQFISRAFYETGNLDDRVVLQPGRAAEEFTHALPEYEDRVAVWFDVPRTVGPESGGVSKSRPAEAAAIARELKRLLDSPQADGLTFGVIAFYRRQVNELWVALVNEGLAERHNGEIHLLPAYREVVGTDGLPIERVRVGTVDEFQGREFDVVFLSVTRSNGISATGPKAVRQKFGHLVLANRMCVAMSRQKRLLVVAGDRGMLEHPEAATAIPALLEFSNLCEAGLHAAV
jgi:hypothetical protein